MSKSSVANSIGVVCIAVAVVWSFCRVVVRIVVALTVVGLGVVVVVVVVVVDVVVVSLISVDGEPSRFALT